jgi:hypothetical protein
MNTDSGFLRRANFPMGTTNEKGQAFEAKVASWAKNQFNAAVVNRNEL